MSDDSVQPTEQRYQRQVARKSVITTVRLRGAEERESSANEREDEMQKCGDSDRESEGGGVGTDDFSNAGTFHWHDDENDEYIDDEEEYYEITDDYPIFHPNKIIQNPGGSQLMADAINDEYRQYLVHKDRMKECERRLRRMRRRWNRQAARAEENAAIGTASTAIVGIDDQSDMKATVAKKRR